MKLYTVFFQKIIAAASLGMAIALVPYSFSAAGDRPQSSMLNVPYTSQAPFGEWSDPRQRDGCEEASLVMAMSWVRGGTVPPEEAVRDIVNLSEYERVRFGFFEDTSIADTAQLLKEFYAHQKYLVMTGITTDDIKNELASGNLVIIPLNTRLLGGDFYQNGPLRHTVVAVGYDDQADQIIIHDPYVGGAFKSIPSASISAAMWDYQSGVHLALPAQQSAMLVIYR